MVSIQALLVTTLISPENPNLYEMHLKLEFLIIFNWIVTSLHYKADIRGITFGIPMHLIYKVIGFVLTKLVSYFLSTIKIGYVLILSLLRGF